MAVVLIFKGIMGPEGVKVIHFGAPNSVSDSVSTVTRTILKRMVDKRDEKDKEPRTSASVNVE